MKIEISKEIIARLKNYEDLFYKTPNDVIGFLLDEYENHLAVLEYPLINPPELSFSRIIRCNLGEAIEGWNPLVKKVIIIASKSIDDPYKLIELLPANIKKGKVNQNGFYYIEKLDLSVRYVDANTAWNIASRIAVNYRIQIKVLFKWDQQNLLHPNQFGKLKVNALL